MALAYGPAGDEIFVEISRTGTTKHGQLTLYVCTICGIVVADGSIVQADESVASFAGRDLHRDVHTFARVVPKEPSP